MNSSFDELSSWLTPFPILMTLSICSESEKKKIKRKFNVKFHLLLLHGIFFKAKTIARPCRRSNFKIKRKERLVFLIFFDLFVTGTATCKSPCQSVGRSVGRSVGLSHFAFLFAFLGILRVGKFVFEHAPAQVITAPAQPTATGVVVYTALLTQPPELQFSIFYRHAG